jgi:hypothetical protein
MKNENPILKEKEIIRDYYLKRMLIYSFSGISAPFVTLALFFLGVFVWEILYGKGGDNNGIVVGLIVGVVIWFISMVLAIYYTTKFWKAHKECQELANPTFTSEQQHVTN